MNKVEGVEVCPHCEAEIEFSVDENVTWMKCPECGSVLVLCDKCMTDLLNAGKTEADRKCYQCPICRNAYLDGFKRGMARADEVIFSYDVTDTTTGIDDEADVSVANYKDDSFVNKDGSKPLYDVIYWDMAVILDDWRKENYTTPIAEIDKALLERANG